MNLSSVPAGGQVHAWNHGPLLKSGKFSGTQLPSRPATGKKSVTTAASVSPSLAVVVPAQFDGVALPASNCGCQPPDVNAAVGPSNIVETVNLQLAVYSKAGALQTSVSLAGFLGTADTLSDPRVIYDPTWDRYILSITDVTAFGTTPTLWMAASASNNPSGTWFIYHIAFSGGPFPTSEFLDYPVLGMDADAAVVTTNNFAQPSAGSFTYNGSTAFAVSKARLYNGFGFSFRAFGVAFGTAPAIVGGRPTQDTGRLYLLSTDDLNNVIHVYFIVNTSRSDSTVLTFKGDVAYTFAAPSRRVNQPGTAQTLDPLDGRIVWAPSQLDGLVWFAHGVDLAGFPGVNWGFVQPGPLTVTSQTAFHSGTSDDFNPSIAVERVGTYFQEILNWAYTDTSVGVPTRNLWDFNINASLAHKAGRQYSLNGASTGEFRFGDYSSVSPDYFGNGACPANQSAIVANQYFAADGTWKTRIASVGVC